MTPEEFTKHVGAATFEEAVAVTLRTKQQDEEKIEEMFNQIKDLGKKLRTALETIDELNQAAIDAEFGG